MGRTLYDLCDYDAACEVKEGAVCWPVSDELAVAAGASRMTVVRLEAEQGSPSTITVAALAFAVGKTLSLSEPESGRQTPSRITHRGLSHNRTKHDLDWDDRKREKALADSWEDVNQERTVGLEPIMKSLVPNYSGEQAVAAATVVQWLGSEVGFGFLTKALANAGYAITKVEASKRKARVR
ncbi:hypothetical protein ACSFA0_25320 [Variovorax sp. LT1P1]|uniref:hypothetical protein n=1 Tax=Variovorax sp. LT1P1 TaxID=3443730 RepID=UPI003F48AD03